MTSIKLQLGGGVPQPLYDAWQREARDIVVDGFRDGLLVAGCYTFRREVESLERHAIAAGVEYDLLVRQPGTTLLYSHRLVRTFPDSTSPCDAEAETGSAWVLKGGTVVYEAEYLADENGERYIPASQLDWLKSQEWRDDPGMRVWRSEYLRRLVFPYEKLKPFKIV